MCCRVRKIGRMREKRERRIVVHIDREREREREREKMREEIEKKLRKKEREREREIERETCLLF